MDGSANIWACLVTYLARYDLCPQFCRRQSCGVRALGMMSSFATTPSTLCLAWKYSTGRVMVRSRHIPPPSTQIPTAGTSLRLPRLLAFH